MDLSSKKCNKERKEDTKGRKDSLSVFFHIVLNGKDKWEDQRRMVVSISPPGGGGSRITSKAFLPSLLLTVHSALKLVSGCGAGGV